MNYKNTIDNKLVEIELKIKKQIQKYAIEPNQTKTIKRYTDKYYKDKISNTKKVQKIVEYEILPEELKMLLKRKDKNYITNLDSSSTTDTETRDDVDLEDDENDYNIDYENNEEEFVDDEQYTEDEYES